MIAPADPSPPRLPDWEARLADYLEAVRETPFEWGRHDCALFAAGAAAAMTGTDLGAAFRGRYSTRRGAAAALRRFGAGTIESTFDRHWRRIEPAFAQPGDLVLARGSVGVCMGDHALFVGEESGAPDATEGFEGLVRLNFGEWRSGWRV